MDENTEEMSVSSDESFVQVADFDWIEYFERVNAKSTEKKKPLAGVPDSAFEHVEASLDSGVKEGYVVEFQWDEGNNLYWLAIIENVYGPLLKLTYVGEPEPEEFWHDLSKRRLYPLGWCQQNKFKLEPPDHIRKVCNDWETLAFQYLEDISYDTISMHHIEGQGVTPFERLKLGLVLEIQDSEKPYNFWPVKIIGNLGCLLTLEYVNLKDETETIFYLSSRLFPKGHAANTKGLKYVVPSHLISSYKDVNVNEAKTIDAPSVPEDLFQVSDKEPEKHKFEVGLHLEMIHPTTFQSLERCVVEQVVDEFYFIVQSVSNPSFRRVVSMMDPTIFPCGTYKSLRSVGSVSDANSRGKVVQKRNFPDFKSAEELGFTDRQKLVVHENSIFRTATIIETKNHLLVLEMDQTEKKYLFKSAHSMDIFPLGWCSTNGIMLQIPRIFLQEQQPEEIIEEVVEKPIDVKPIEPVASSWCNQVFFNYKCYSSSFLSKARLAGLPKSVGPGPVQLVMRTVLNHLVGSSYKSGSILRRLELKEDATPGDNFAVEEVKGKSRVVNLKAKVEIPTRQDQVDPYLRGVCQKVGACPFLVSTTLYEDGCPEDCQNKPKSEFDQQPKTQPPPPPPLSDKPHRPRGRKRKSQPSILMEKVIKDDSTTPTSEDSDNSSSRTNSPPVVTVRKRGGLPRIVKLNENQDPEKISKIKPAAKSKDPKSDQVRRRPGRPREIRVVKEIISEVEDESSSSEDTEEIPSANASDGSELPPPRLIKLFSNPELWSPMDTAKFLAQTTDCFHLAPLMLQEAIDGQAFLLLNYPTVKEHWALDTSTAIQLCQHIESVRLAHLFQF